MSFILLLLHPGGFAHSLEQIRLPFLHASEGNTLSSQRKESDVVSIKQLKLKKNLHEEMNNQQIRM